MAATLYSGDYDDGIIMPQQSQNDKEMVWPLVISPYIKSRAMFFDPSRPMPSINAATNDVTLFPGYSEPWSKIINLSINDSGYTGYWETVGGTCAGKVGSENYHYGGRTLATMEEPERRVAFSPSTWGGTDVGYHFFQAGGYSGNSASWIDPKALPNSFSFSNQVWDTRRFYSGGTIPIVHADGSAGRLKAKDFISKAVAPKKADWCAWMNEEGARTWGAFWRPN
jgi:hypothetical protein